MKRLTIVLIGLLAGTHSFAGQERGGGAQVEIDFAEMGRLVSVWAEESVRSKEGLFDGFSVPAFREALRRTEVAGLAKQQCNTFLDLNTGERITRCLDAEYFPDRNLIEFHVGSWEKKTCVQRAALVMHEYGRAAGIETGNYEHSSKVGLSPVVQENCQRYDASRRAADRASCRPHLAELVLMLRGIPPPKGISWHQKSEFQTIFRSRFVDFAQAKVPGRCHRYVEDVCFGVCREVAGEMSDVMCEPAVCAFAF